MLRCWRIAEVIYQAAIRRGADESAFHFRLGQVREHRGDLAGAERAYRATLEHDPAAAFHHFRLARVLDARGELDGAEEAFTAALERQPDSAPWYRQRARLREKRSRHTEAAEDYRRAVALDPDRRDWHLALAQALEKARRPLEAVDAYTQAARRFGETPSLLRKLAHAYEKCGDFAAARTLLQGVLADHPADREAQVRLAVCLDRLAHVPFRIVDGVPAPADGADAALGEQATEHFEAALRAHARRVTWLHRLAGRLARRKWLYRVAMRMPLLASRVHRRVSRPETRLRRLHDLGRMYERQGRLERAAESYAAAVEGLESADAIWVHKAEPAWRFRLEHVRHRRHPGEPDDVRLLRGVEPAPVQPGQEADPAAAGGFIDAVIADVGLHLEGFVLPGLGETVELRVDGALVKSVAVNTTSWLPAFTFDISHKTLAHLPREARLSVAVEGRPLLARGGAAELLVHVPDGTGRLAELLASGHSISKKGVLALPAEEASDRQMRYLKSYCEARDTFEEVLGKKLFLLYGTLLGCYRDRAFIAGDDDFDVAYVSEAGDPVELKRELQSHALALLGAGYDVSITVTGRLFKVRLERTWLDVNALWFYGGRAWSFDAHDLRREDFEPVTSMDFLGHEVYVPNNIEAFLEDNYGADWRVPQPDFRYYRREEDRRVLRRSWLTPSEAREFSRLAETERAKNSAAGRFVGIGDPADTGFSF